MVIRVRYYAILRDITGKSEESLEIKERKLSELISLLNNKYPKLSEFMGKYKITVLVNGSICSDDCLIKDGDLVEFLPPSSGGSGSDEVRIISKDDVIDLNAVVNELRSNPSLRDCGSIAIYIGIVKGLVNGKAVHELEYIIHEDYTYKKLKEIINDIKGRYKGIKVVKIYHRKGRLKPGEEALYTFITGVRRKDVFQTLSEIINRIKLESGIWKIERREDGEYWVIGDGERIPRKPHSSSDHT
ncbi:MAG TPA: MoaD family protein [Acidilobales archaeon]|nr:MoaD family protein [Acidilobales archaeon]